MEQIKIITLSDVIENQRKSIWHKIVPILLFVSFLVANIYYAIMLNNTVSIEIPTSGSSEVFYYLLVYGLIEYLLYRLTFWIYTIILNHSVFAMCVPYIVFKDQFQTCYLIRNVIMGIFGVLLLYIPYTLPYLPVIGLALDLAIIPIIFKINRNKFIPDLVAHNVFRAYALPYFIFFMLDIISFVIEVA